MNKNGRSMHQNFTNERFTVVIPTRERCDMLEHSLRTCIIQDYDNLEIIVSDNFSQDRTREVVDSFNDPRIHYLNTGRRLSMADNYEFALSHIRPEGYILYIGDDDGLLPNAIRDIHAVVTKTGAAVLRWDIPTYWWPTAEYRANQLAIPYLGSGLTMLNAANAIQNILSFKVPYTACLPLMYQYSAIKYEVIQKIKSLSGRFYHAMAADVYSGFAIAGAVDRFAASKRPYTIAGVSHNSIGASQMSFTFTDPMQKFLSEGNPPFHASLVFCSSMPQTVIECFFQARDHLPFFRNFTVDMEKMVFLMMEEAAPKAQENYTEVRNAVLRLGEMHNIPEAAHRAIAANPKREPGSGRKLKIRNLANAGIQLTRLFASDIVKGSFYLDCSSLNVKNIYEASLLCDHILRLKDRNVIGLSSVVKSSLAHIKKIIAPAGRNSRIQASGHGNKTFAGGGHRAEGDDF